MMGRRISTFRSVAVLKKEEYHMSLIVMLCQLQNVQVNTQTASVFPVIDLARLPGTPLERSLVIKDIRNACREIGFFHDFSIGSSAQERGVSYVPDCYVMPASERPSQYTETASVFPVIDLARLPGTPLERSLVIKDIRNACREIGFFHIINHGIRQSVLDEALLSASDFFELPKEKKEEFMSNDVIKPVRYGTGLKNGLDKVQFWRFFLKHYAHPLKDWIESWPSYPQTYREKMGTYAMDLREVAMKVMEAITESLSLGPSYISKEMEQGMQVMAVNCYPPCPQPADLVLGLPPHSDYTCITILLQSCPGLEVITTDDVEWKRIPELQGALQVHVGDHLEVLSNGVYKSLLHRATLNSEKNRISIVSLHSLGMDTKMETAKELVDEQHPKGYKGSSFRDVLKFISANDLSKGTTSFIQTLKIINN